MGEDIIMRNVVASLIFIITELDTRRYLLRQWDQKANQYQIIGGRKKGDEKPIETAIREIEEELSELSLKYGENYDLYSLEKRPLIVLGKSPTYGVNTKYKIHFFYANLSIKKIELFDQNRWTLIDELINVPSHKKEDEEFYKKVDSFLEGGLSSIPISVDSKCIIDINIL